jgi:predicted AAA+ superfamily ATPase
VIGRLLEKTLMAKLSKAAGRKVVVLLGARQVGKTTLMGRVFGQLSGRKEFLNGDYADDRALLVPERAALHRLAGHLKWLFIDEAQNISEAGRVLKLLHDEFPGLRVAASGSSSFDLRRRTGEPLTGRQTVLEMFPISFAERKPTLAGLPVVVEEGMVFGGYPEVVTARSPQEKEEYLRQLVADYLLKDIFAQVEVNRAKLHDLLRMVALQVGAEVSLNELAGGLRMDVKTVDRYLGLLEDAFVIVRLRGYSRNLRKEVVKSRKIYFLDNGVRNAVLNAFEPLLLRGDAGMLWENWLISERMKRNAYADDAGAVANPYFWRTYDRQEIDYIEESREGLAAFEFKWNPAKGRKARPPKAWIRAYPESRFQAVTPENMMDFLEHSQSESTG